MSKIKILLTLQLSIALAVLLVSCNITITESKLQVDTTNDNDATAPTIMRIAAMGDTNTATIIFSENIQFGSTGNPNGAGFTVHTIDSSAVNTLNSITAASIIDNALTLTLTNNLEVGQRIKINFTADSIYDTVESPNKLFPNISIEFNIEGDIDITAPTITSVAATGATTTITITFSEAINFGTNGKSDGTGFTIEDNTVNAASIADNVLTLTVTTALPTTGTFKVTFATNAIVNTAPTPIAFADTDSGNITIVEPPTQDEFYFYTDKADKRENYAPTFTFVPGYESTITNVEQDTGGADSTAKYQKLTRANAINESATGGWLDPQNGGTIDLSKYNTLVFWVKSDTVISSPSLIFYMQEKGNEAAVPPQNEIYVSTAWIKHEISFTQLGIVDATKILRLVYMLKNASVQIDLDEVYVYKKPDTTAPTISTGHSASGKTVTVIFTENITFADGATTATTPLTGITVTTGASGTVTTGNAITKASITDNTLTLTLTNALDATEKVKVAFTDGSIKDTADIPNSIVAIDTGEITITAADTTAPIIANDGHSADSANKTVTINFTENITFANGSTTVTTAPIGITVTTGASGTVTTGNAITEASITDNTLTLTLTNALVATEKVKVAFADGSILDTADTPNSITESDTGEIDITAADTTAPIIANDGHITEGAADTVTINFNENITFANGSTTVTTAPFGITVSTGTNESFTSRTVTQADIGGTTLTLLLSTRLTPNEQVKVEFTEDAIIDIAGNKLAATSKQLTITEAPTEPMSGPSLIVNISNAIKVYSDSTEFASTVSNLNTTPSWSTNSEPEEKTYDSNKVLKYVNLSYAGITFDAIDVSSTHKLYFDYWTAESQNFDFSVRYAPSGEEPVVTSLRIIPTTNSWTTAEVDISSFTADQKKAINQLLLETIGAQTNITTVYIDNIYFK